jgi:hypothetical protein
VVTYSESGDNTIEIPSFDADGAGTYSLDYTAVLGSGALTRSLLLDFEVIYCEFEVDHDQSTF